MTNKQPTVSLFKHQNDGLVIDALRRTDADWVAVHSVVLQREELCFLSGNEYIILHSHYGVILLDILPTTRTSHEASEVLKASVSHEAAAEFPPIQIWESSIIILMLWQSG
ncbi:hypothetical protein ACFQY5_27060 [Paeniroseomonas aquatica]|uniref:hypothetical protein n=1 Tax=Paeniroseomonas aquatica TaxID=373043 RepID=UPI00360BBB69